MNSLVSYGWSCISGQVVGPSHDTFLLHSRFHLVCLEKICRAHRSVHSSCALQNKASAGCRIPSDTTPPLFLPSPKSAIQKVPISSKSPSARREPRAKRKERSLLLIFGTAKDLLAHRARGPFPPSLVIFLLSSSSSRPLIKEIMFPIVKIRHGHIISAGGLTVCLCSHMYFPYRRSLFSCDFRPPMTRPPVAFFSLPPSPRHLEWWSCFFFFLPW